MREMIWKKIEPELEKIPHEFGKQTVRILVHVEMDAVKTDD